MKRSGVLVLVAALLLAACSGADDATGDGSGDGAGSAAADTPAGADDRFPDILAVEAVLEPSTGTWRFDVTVSSPYDTPARYADGWRVVGPDGTVYGVHTLAHDHANEQPFTRVQSGVVIPDDVDEVTIEGRDQANGFGGGTVTVSLEAAR